MELKSFTIFKNDYKKEDKHPDYTISTKIGEKFVKVGAGWKKEKDGKQFISCVVDDKPYEPAKKVEYPENTTKPEDMIF